MKITKKTKLEYKNKIDKILDSVALDAFYNRIPNGFKKIDYLFDVFNKHCKSNYCAKEARLINAINFLEEKLDIDLSL